MEISSAHHQQMMSSHALEEVIGGCPKTQQQQERKPRPQPEQALRCPRCDSTNTKFCYYNNYSLSQPRYFCKGCRRYWTQGGSLRNVPVGGGCRKNKRSTSSSSSSSKKAAQDQSLINTNNNHNHNPLLPSLSPPLPLLSYDPSDLSLAFARLHKQPCMDDPFLLGNPNPNHTHIPTASTSSGFLDILRNGFLDSTTTTPTTTTTTVTNPGGFHNFYYGFGGNGSVEEVEGGIGGEEAVLPFDGSLGVAAAAEAGGSHGSSCKAMDGGENKMLMGLQWQLGGDGSMAVDSSRDYWNGAASSWHGLINSSLI